MNETGINKKGNKTRIKSEEIQEAFAEAGKGSIDSIFDEMEKLRRLSIERTDTLLLSEIGKVLVALSHSGNRVLFDEAEINMLKKEFFNIINKYGKKDE